MTHGELDALRAQQVTAEALRDLVEEIRGLRADLQRQSDERAVAEIITHGGRTPAASISTLQQIKNMLYEESYPEE